MLRTHVIMGRSLGQHLADRLSQIGCKRFFGVPGALGAGFSVFGKTTGGLDRLIPCPSTCPSPEGRVLVTSCVVQLPAMGLGALGMSFPSAISLPLTHAFLGAPQATTTSLYGRLCGIVDCLLCVCVCVGE